MTRTLKPQRPPNVYQDQPSMFAALASKQIDAVLLDTVNILPVAQKSAEALQVVGQYRTGGAYGALFPKGDPQKGMLDDVITLMKADGTLKRLSAKYLTAALGEDPNNVTYLQP